MTTGRQLGQLANLAARVYRRITASARAVGTLSSNITEPLAHTLSATEREHEISQTPACFEERAANNLIQLRRHMNRLDDIATMVIVPNASPFARLKSTLRATIKSYTVPPELISQGFTAPDPSASRSVYCLAPSTYRGAVTIAALPRSTEISYLLTGLSTDLTVAGWQSFTIMIASLGVGNQLPGKLQRGSFKHHLNTDTFPDVVARHRGSLHRNTLVLNPRMSVFHQPDKTLTSDTLHVSGTPPLLWPLRVKMDTAPSDFKSTLRDIHSEAARDLHALVKHVKKNPTCRADALLYNAYTHLQEIDCTANWGLGERKAFALCVLRHFILQASFHRHVEQPTRLHDTLRFIEHYTQRVIDEYRLHGEDPTAFLDLTDQLCRHSGLPLKDRVNLDRVIDHRDATPASFPLSLYR